MVGGFAGRGDLSHRFPRGIVTLLIALVPVEIAVGLAVISHAALYLALAILGLGVVYLVLRCPTSIAYVALTWMVFEKGIGGHFGSLSNTISIAGDGLLVLALLWTAVENLMRRRRPVLSLGVIGAGLVGFTTLSLISTFVNAVPLHVAALGILSTLHGVIIFLVITNIGVTARDVHRFVFVALAVMSLASLVGVLQVVPHSPAWVIGGVRIAGSGGLMRVDGPFDHPNSLADYLALTAPIGLMLLAFGGVRGSERTWLTVGTGLMLVATLLTLAREAWISYFVAVIFMGVTVERRLLRLFLNYAVPPLLLLTLVALPFFSSINRSDSGSQRLTLLMLTLPLITSHLWLGVGPGMFGGHVALVTNTPLYAQYHLLNHFYGTGNQIDQFWTHLLAEAGILGLVAYGSMVATCFVVGRRAYRRSVTPRRKAMLLGLLWAVPAAVVVSLVSALLEDGPGTTLFWGLMGMLVVLSTAPEESPVKAAPAVAPSPLTRRRKARTAVEAMRVG